MQNEITYGIRVDTAKYGESLWRREAGQPLEYPRMEDAQAEALNTLGKWPDVDEAPLDDEDAADQEVLDAQIVMIVPLAKMADTKYAVLVRPFGSESEFLLPQTDEYPGSSPWFTSENDAREVARQVIGLGLSSVGDSNKIASARVVRLVEIAAEDDPAESADTLLRKIEASGRTGEVRLDLSYTLDVEGVRRLIQTRVPDEWKFILSVLNSAMTAEKPVLSEFEIARLLTASTSPLRTDQDPWLTFLAIAPEMVEQGCLRVIRKEDGK